MVRRRSRPELAALNRSGALNGHVPITAIVSLIAVVGSFVYGYDTIAMAVERSASEETVPVDGVPVNHQYSKSLEFERLLAELIDRVHRPGPDLRLGPAPLLGAGHRPRLRPAHRLPRHRSAAATRRSGGRRRPGTGGAGSAPSAGSSG